MPDAETPEEAHRSGAPAGPRLEATVELSAMAKAARIAPATTTLALANLLPAEATTA